MGVTFQVLEGIDKGRVFRDLPTPLTIGREEGNILRLNDERVSRFHAKVQIDSEDFILTDLESTNGTRVNGTVVQIRRLRYGDRVSVGRSLLLFGSNEQIAARMANGGGAGMQPFSAGAAAAQSDGPATVQASTLAGQIDGNLDFVLNQHDEMTATKDALFIGKKPLPPLAAETDAVASGSTGGNPRLLAQRHHRRHRKHPGQGRRHPDHAQLP